MKSYNKSIRIGKFTYSVQFTKTGPYTFIPLSIVLTRCFEPNDFYAVITFDFLKYRLSFIVSSNIYNGKPINNIRYLLPVINLIFHPKLTLDKSTNTVTEDHTKTGAIELEVIWWYWDAVIFKYLFKQFTLDEITYISDNEATIKVKEIYDE